MNTNRKNSRIIVVAMAIITLSFFISPVHAYYLSDIEPFLAYNRTLNGNPYRQSGGENIDYPFMIDFIQMKFFLCSGRLVCRNGVRLA